MTRRKSVIFGILMLFKIFFPVNLSQCCHGHILPDLQVIKFAISIPRSASVELTFSNNLNLRLLLSCVHLCTYVCMYVCMYMHGHIRFSLLIFSCQSRSIIIHIYCVSFNFAAGQEVESRYIFYIYVCVQLMNNKLNWFSCGSIILFAFFVT